MIQRSAQGGHVSRSSRESREWGTPSRKAGEGGPLTCADDPLVVALPVETASSLLDRLHDIVRDGTALRTRHETSRTERPREGRVPLKEGKHLGGRDELVRVDVAGEDVVDQFLTAHDVGAGFSCGLGGLAGREHDEGGLLGRRGARVRQEDPPSEGVELDGARGLGRDVDLVGCVGRCRRPGLRRWARDEHSFARRGPRRRRLGLTARTLEASSRVMVCLPLPRLPPLTSPLLARCCRARLVLLSGESTFEHTTGAVEKERAALWCSWCTADASIGRAHVNDMFGVRLRVADGGASGSEMKFKRKICFKSRKSV